MGADVGAQDRFPVGPVIELLEERGSADFCRDAGGISWATWERWVSDGLTSAEAESAAAVLGVLVIALWPEWHPEGETPPETARQRIEGLRAQLVGGDAA